MTRQILESKGWVMIYECLQPCGKRHYTHVDKKGYEIIERIKSSTFSILLNNTLIAGPFWHHQIEEKLNEHGI